MFAFLLGVVYLQTRFIILLSVLIRFPSMSLYDSSLCWKYLYYVRTSFPSSSSKSYNIDTSKSSCFILTKVLSGYLRLSYMLHALLLLCSELWSGWQGSTPTLGSCSIILLGAFSAWFGLKLFYFHLHPSKHVVASCMLHYILFGYINPSNNFKRGFSF